MRARACFVLALRLNSVFRWPKKGSCDIAAPSLTTIRPLRSHARATQISRDDRDGDGGGRHLRDVRSFRLTSNDTCNLRRRPLPACCHRCRPVCGRSSSSLLAFRLDENKKKMLLLTASGPRARARAQGVRARFSLAPAASRLHTSRIAPCIIGATEKRGAARHCRRALSCGRRATPTHISQIMAEALGVCFIELRYFGAAHRVSGGRVGVDSDGGALGGVRRHIYVFFFSRSPSLANACAKVSEPAAGSTSDAE